MPRNGQGVYSLPPNTAAVAGQTIESAPYNTVNNDIANDLNAARPITAGGTGASNAIDAIDNLTVIGTPIASDSVIDLGSATGSSVLLTGGGSVEDFGSYQSGVIRYVTVDTSTTLVYDPAKIVIPGESDITIDENGTFIAQSLGSGTWRIISSSGSAVSRRVLFHDDTIATLTGTKILQLLSDSDDLTNYKYFEIVVSGMVNSSSDYAVMSWQFSEDGSSYDGGVIWPSATTAQQSLKAELFVSPSGNATIPYVAFYGNPIPTPPRTHTYIPDFSARYSRLIISSSANVDIAEVTLYGAT